MAKTKTIFVCQNCGAESGKWLGRCNNCNEWNTLQEEIVSKTDLKQKSSSLSLGNKPVTLKEIVNFTEVRIDTRNNELNRTLGGGIVPGSLILIGGEPGIGKSTLALQVALELKELTVLYVSGEESASQVKLRATRLGVENDNCLFLCETNLESILEHTGNCSPGLVVIDSIQTLHTEAVESSAGSVTQIRECTQRLLSYAKRTQTPFIIIGHITKDGSLAGPKVLEHIVDAVLQFEGDQHYMYRILRSIKNRFGSTSEIGIFEMTGKGLMEVSNPSQILITQNEDKLSGISVSATLNGIRPFLIETQSLVSTAVYGTPQRSATGFDSRRLNMLLAVLEKRAGFRLGMKDVFLNIAGGIRVDDPAIDLSVVASILSSNVDIAINHNICLAGEVGLSGEIRPVNRIEQRIGEAEKLGFSQIIISKYNQKSINKAKFGIEIASISKIDQLVKLLFG